MYIRKTHAEYDIQGNYGYGWETVTTELTWREAKEQVKVYRENEPQFAHRVKINSRVKNDDVAA